MSRKDDFFSSINAGYTCKGDFIVLGGAMLDGEAIADAHIKIPLKTPALDPMGFHLMGGRLLPTDRGSAAQFMYEDGQGRRVTLYIRSDLQGNRETAFRYVQDETGVGMFYWIDGAKGYAVAAQMPRQELMEIATKVYDDLEK